MTRLGLIVLAALEQGRVIAVLAARGPGLEVVAKDGHLDDVRGDGRGRREGQEPAQRHERCRV